jgi:hypothetical protein
MKIAFILSLFLYIILATLSAIIHVMLDIRNDHRIDFARSKGYVYLLLYDKNVSEKDEKLKRICNYLKRISFYFLIFLVIILFVRFILMHFYFFVT